MARRRIGQESFGFGDFRARRQSSLDDLCGLIDWAPVEHHLAVISCAAKGEPAWPPLALFKAMLKGELRVDEADRPFLWVTSIKPI